MKIYANPFEVSVTGRFFYLNNHHKKIDSVLNEILKALNDMRTIIARIDKVNKEKKSMVMKKDDIQQLVKALDSVVDRCRIGRERVLDGKFGKVYPRASMWFLAGIWKNQRERIFINTMTASALGFVSIDGKVYPPDNKFNSRIKKSLERIEKVESDVNSYKNRIKLIISGAEGAKQFKPLKNFLEKDIMKHQLNLLYYIDRYLQVDYKVVKRLKELARKANGKSPQKRLYLQVEVSALIDEVDRIASQAEFNKYRLMTGNFSNINPGASMWFLADSSPDKIKRIYINTMTSRSLFLRDNQWRNLSLSSSAESEKLLQKSIKKIQDERKRIKGYISFFEKEKKLDTDIKVGKDENIKH